MANALNNPTSSLTIDHTIKPMGHHNIKIVKGDGLRFWDDTGTEYLDAVSGEWVVNLGYRNPRVLSEIKKQLDKIEYVTPVFENDKRTELTSKILSYAPERMKSVLYAVSGADAVEGAMHLAMRATGGSEFVCLDGAFHGTTFGALALTYTYPNMIEGAKQGLERYLAKQIRVPNYNQYRCEFCEESGGCNLRCADHIETAIQRQSDSKVAGVIIELFQANGGMIPVPDGYVEKVRDICTRNECALIIDEVQTAFDRCGDIFASNVLGADPDLIILGKAFGAGFPLSGVLAAEGYTSLRGWEAGFTLMSTPAICAASIGMLEVMDEGKLGENSANLGEYILDKLRELQGKYPIIGDVRGLGLMIGVELVHDRVSKEPANDLTQFAWEYALHKEHLLLGKSGPVFGSYGNVLKLKPAVNLTHTEADEILKRFENTLEATQKQT